VNKAEKPAESKGSIVNKDRNIYLDTFASNWRSPTKNATGER